MLVLQGNMQLHQVQQVVLTALQVHLQLLQDHQFVPRVLQELTRIWQVRFHVSHAPRGNTPLLQGLLLVVHVD